MSAPATLALYYGVAGYLLGLWWLGLTHDVLMVPGAAGRNTSTRVMTALGLLHPVAALAAMDLRRLRAREDRAGGVSPSESVLINLSLVLGVINTAAVSSIVLVGGGGAVPAILLLPLALLSVQVVLSHLVAARWADPGRNYWLALVVCLLGGALAWALFLVATPTRPTPRPQQAPS